MTSAIVVAGVRPQYVKAPTLVGLLRSSGIATVYMDARQHYAEELTLVVQAEFDAPDVVLTHRSKSRDAVAASIYEQLCSRFSGYAANPEDVAVVVMGDTTTSFMAAAACARIGLKLVHVEAGIRSAPNATSGPSIENKYRRMIGQISNLNLCVLEDHVRNLARESAPGRSVWVGDLSGRPVVRPGTEPVDQVVCHVHKSENLQGTAFPEIVRALGACGYPTVLINHPTYRVRADDLPSNVHVIAPVSHSELLTLVAGSRVCLTDSGSVQREAAQLGRRCVVRRDTAGWKELFGDGGHLLAGPKATEVSLKLSELWESPEWRLPRVEFFPNGGRTLALHEIGALLRPPTRS